MGSVRETVRELVDRSIGMSSGTGATGHGTVVITAGPGLVQWLAEPEGVFHVEVADPARQSRRTLLQRLRRRPEKPGTPPFTEQQLAVLTHLGFVAGNPNYELRPNEGGLDYDHVVHAVTTVLQDILSVREAEELSAEVF